MHVLKKETIEQYKYHLIYAEKSKSTIDKYIRDITAFHTWLNGNEINKGLVLKYKDTLMEKYADTSVNSIISSINSLFCYLGWHDCNIKMLRIQKQIFIDKNKELTKTEYERLLMAAKNKKNERLYYVMQTICATGIRVSELRYITVEAVSNGLATIRCKGKTRVVILPRKLCKMLRQYIKKRKIASGTIFKTKNGKPLDRSNIWSEMKRLCDAAGVLRSKVFPHNLRHLFARTFYEIRKDIVRLADILGHSSINTTRIYTLESGEVHRQQIEQMGLLRC